ncbi:uncharacterized protein LOC121368289 isoform X1 [Gigantopelta aegis]|uniref:uncharacterized protein LOC121368289 isoform X1 n=1 Tax=Gigantopelta aegis TaxID=1735272 RepID=UPI001B88C3DD|nr:uncharacterized protein LOC121368289 isoform X1 [Gigantopelta aegis]
MAKQNLLLNQKHSDGKSQNAASNTGGHLSNSKSNSFSKSSKSSSGKSGGSSFGVFDKTGLTNGKTGTHRGVGSRGRIGDIGNRYGHNQMFNNLGNFFRQPASKAGATIKDKNKFNFGSLDDFMNEEFRHNQDALQPIFNRNPFSNQGYGKLFPNENFQLASANRGNGKRSNSNSIPHSAGNLHTEYGRFFDFV